MSEDQRPARTPRKLDLATAFAIVAAIRADKDRKQVAEAAGISRSTLQDWLTRGWRGEAAFAPLWAGIRQAEKDKCIERMCEFYKARQYRPRRRRRKPAPVSPSDKLPSSSHPNAREAANCPTTEGTTGQAF